MSNPKPLADGGDAAAESLTRDLEAVRRALDALRVPRPAVTSGELPAPEVEWPILVTFDAPVSSQRVLEAFDPAWWHEHDAVLYALPAGGLWGRTGDEPVAAEWQAMQVAVRLPGDAEPRSQTSLERVLADVRDKAALLGALLTEPRYPIDSAVLRADELRRLRDHLEQSDDGCVHLAVHNPAGYASGEIERVLAEIGFELRKGGLFALTNAADCLGHELILAAMLEEDSRVALWFAVPRVAAPFAVLDAMVAVASLIVSRLGGEIVDEAGQRLNVLLLRANVADLVQRLDAAHLAPGGTGMSLL
jgi:hypothetical protein